MHLDPHFKVVLLIEAKADVNQATTSDGATPLYMAALKGHVEVVEALVACGGVWWAPGGGFSPPPRQFPQDLPLHPPPPAISTCPECKQGHHT